MDSKFISGQRFMAGKKRSPDDTDADETSLVAGEDPSPGVATSQFVKDDPEKTPATAPGGTAASATSETESDLEDAALRGDALAIARLKLAKQAREENEHIDVDDDGEHDEPEPEILSTLFTRDEFGGFVAKDDDYYDSFGGHYDSFGYTAEDGSYTNTSGERYNAGTNEFKEKNGKTMEVPGAVTQMAAEDKTAGAEFLSMAEAEQHRIDSGANRGADPKAGLQQKPAVNRAAASRREGGGQETGNTPTGKEAREVATIGTAMKQDDKHHGRHTKKDYEYLPEAERIQWRLRKELGERANQVLADHQKLLDYIHAHPASAADAKLGAAATPADKGQAGAEAMPSEFTAVSADVVAKTLHSQPAVHHGDGAKASSGDKVEAAASTTWYADKDGGYWDEFGGYYDKTGAYWDTDGTFYSADGKFNIDPKGGTHWTDGSYTDTHGHTVDKDGDYVDFDGTKVKPPEGVDFKKQMIEADQKGERWTPPERAAPLSAEDTRLPSTILDNLPFTFTPSLNLPPLQLQPQIPVAAPATAATDLRLTPPKLIADTTKTAPVIATDAKQDANFKVDASRFTQAACTEPGTKSSSWSFSSLFSGVHDWMMGSNKTTTVKDTRFLDTASPTACTTSPLALNSGGVTPLMTAPETKTAVAPKMGL